MSETEIAQKAPYEVELVVGKDYAWCARGRSANFPYRDGTRSGL